jgi:hypothetical protein
MSKSVYPDYSSLNQRELKALNYFWFGFIIYTLSYTFLTTDLLSYRVCQPIQFIGLVLFTGASFFLIQFKFESKYLRTIYILYIMWLFTIISRGFQLNADFIKSMMFEDYQGIFPYFAPLILLFPQNFYSYKKLFKVIITIGIFYFIFDAISIKSLLNRDISNVASRNILENFSRHLAFPSTFLLLAYSYQSRNVKIFTWSIAVITTLFAIIRARRGMLFTFADAMAFSFIIYLSESKKKMAIVMISLFSVLLITIYGLQFFNNSSMFQSFRSRVDEDTRSGVEECFYNDMSTTDWIIGKGITGHYYCANVDPGNRTGYRSVIETDYLNIILKGGVISLLLFLLITVPAAIKGIFYSKNILSKAAGFWVFLWILSLYPTTVVTFNLNYLILWLTIGICYSKKFRNVPEGEMSFFLKNNANIGFN